MDVRRRCYIFVGAIMSPINIKIIAIVTMLIDHIGMFFMPEAIWMRCIGRLSFPLFCYLCAQGFIHSRNVRVYAFRLLMLGIVSQFPYMIVMYPISSVVSLNVLFTLVLGLFACDAFRSFYSTESSVDGHLYLVVVIFCCIVAEICGCEYGCIGVLCVLFFYCFRSDEVGLVLVMGSLWGLSAWVHNDLLYSIFAFSSVFIVSYANGRQGLKLKYLF